MEDFLLGLVVRWIPVNEGNSGHYLVNSYIFPPRSEIQNSAETLLNQN